MTALTVQGLLWYINTCTPQSGGRPIVSTELIASVAQAESARSPLAIHDNATGHTLNPKTIEDATATARQLIAAGHRLDLGLMQVTVSNLGPYGITVQEAFDPCKSVAVGARILAAGMSAYNTGSPTAGVSTYVPKVEAAAKNILPKIDSTPPPPTKPPDPSTKATDPKVSDLKDADPDDPCAGVKDWCVSNQEKK